MELQEHGISFQNQCMMMKKITVVFAALLLSATAFSQSKKAKAAPPPPPPPRVEMKDLAPPPPPEPAAPAIKDDAFFKRNPNVKGLWIEDETVTIELKSGSSETYDLGNKEEAQQLEKKYGKLPEPPPPPSIKKTRS